MTSPKLYPAYQRKIIYEVMPSLLSKIHGDGYPASRSSVSIIVARELKTRIVKYITR